MIKFLVNKRDYSTYEIEHQITPTLDDLQEGEVLLKVDHFSFTSNNITYAVTGDRIGYWNFFPTKEDYGIIPVWGFADVVASKHEHLKTGGRYYGYYPMGSHLVVQPTKVSPFGFIDAASHRRQLPPIYNFYTNSQVDPIYTKDTEALQCLVRPLFTTSFLIDDVLAEHDFYGAKNIILTSASSKTGYALGALLANRKQRTGENFNIIGLTSQRNVEFVTSLGFYDQVINYDDLETIATDEDAVIVDFAGNHNLQYRLQIHLGAALKYNCLVGLVHWNKMRGANKLPAKGEFFFAPTHAHKRNKEWGPEGFQKRLSQSWNNFLEAASAHINITYAEDNNAISELYINMLQGKIDPKQGNMIRWIERV